MICGLNIALLQSLRETLKKKGHYFIEKNIKICTLRLIFKKDKFVKKIVAGCTQNLQKLFTSFKSCKFGIRSNYNIAFFNC